MCKRKMEVYVSAELELRDQPFLARRGSFEATKTSLEKDGAVVGVD